MLSYIYPDQKMPLLRSSTYVLGLLLLTGCAQKSAWLNDLSARTASIPGVGVCGTLDTLEIIDERPGVSERALQVPLISVPGQRDEIRPALSDSLKRTVEQEVGSRVWGDSTPVTVTVRITDGVQRFRSKFLGEQESVHWTVEVALESIHGNVAAGGSMEAMVESRDASLGFVERLSQEILRGSIAQALEGAAQRLLPEAQACRKSGVGPSRRA